MQRNIYWIDHIKSVCIFLVVYGHALSTSPLIKNAIYTFHLPVFLAVTGFLNASTLSGMGAGRKVYAQTRYYFYLYIFFSVVASIVWYLLEARSESILRILGPLVGMAYGLHGPDLKLMHNNDPLWYFPFLISSTVLSYIFYLLFRASWAWLAITISLILSAPLWTSFPPLPWSFDIAPLGAIFIGVGLGVRFLYDGYSRLFEKLTSPLMMFLYVSIWLSGGLFNGVVNINGRLWGDSWWLFLICAASAIFGLVSILKRVPVLAISTELSKHTLLIFCSHIYLTKIIVRLTPRIPNGLQDVFVFFSAVFVTFVCYKFSVVMQPVLIRWLKPSVRVANCK